MANYDGPGFVKILSDFSPVKMTAGAAIAKGDAVMFSGGKLAVYVESAGARPVGFALEAATADGDKILVAADPNLVFVLQVDTGTAYVATTHDQTVVDLIGGTGALEVNLDANASGSIHVLAHYDRIPGRDAAGANALVICKWAKHAFATSNPASEGSATFDSISADVISEKTAGSGVTADGTLLKDGGITCADGATAEVDTINEATAGAGVTADGVLHKDGGITCSAAKAVKADVISEVTAGAGVTADGVLLKDGGSMDVVARINKLDNSAAGYAAVADLVDNTGGAADGTMESCAVAVTGVDGTDDNAAAKADVDTRLVSIANNLADLGAKLNLILARLRVTGGANIIAD